MIPINNGNIPATYASTALHMLEVRTTLARTGDEYRQ